MCYYYISIARPPFTKPPGELLPYESPGEPPLPNPLVIFVIFMNYYHNYHLLVLSIPTLCVLCIFIMIMSYYFISIRELSNTYFASIY